MSGDLIFIAGWLGETEQFVCKRYCFCGPEGNKTFARYHTHALKSFSFTFVHGLKLEVRARSLEFNLQVVLFPGPRKLKLEL